MNIQQQQYYFQELQRRQSLLRAYNNLVQTQKVGLSADEEPTTVQVPNPTVTPVQNTYVPPVVNESEEEVVPEETIEEDK